jgi:hypothetical protein
MSAALAARFETIKGRHRDLMRWLLDQGLDDSDVMDEEEGAFTASRKGWTRLQIDAHETCVEVLRRSMDLIQLFESPQDFPSADEDTVELLGECEELLDHIDAVRAGVEAATMRAETDEAHRDRVWRATRPLKVRPRRAPRRLVRPRARSLTRRRRRHVSLRLRRRGPPRPADRPPSRRPHSVAARRA